MDGSPMERLLELCRAAFIDPDLRELGEKAYAGRNSVWMRDAYEEACISRPCAGGGNRVTFLCSAVHEYKWFVSACEVRGEAGGSTA